MSSNSTSRGKPIHQVRDLRSTPDEAEPSYSYEQEYFLAQKEDAVEEAFLQKHPTNRRDSTGSQNSASNLYREGSSRDNGKSSKGSNSATAAGGGSFWRMEALNNSGQSPHGRSAVMASPMQSGRTRTVGGNKLKKTTSGGGGSLLGAALRASSSAASVGSDTPSVRRIFPAAANVELD